MGKRGQQTGSEAAKRRVETIRARYGPTYFSDLGKLTAEKYGREHYAKLGEKGGVIGGNVTYERHGHEHFVGIGKKSAQVRKQRREQQ